MSLVELNTLCFTNRTCSWPSTITQNAGKYQSVHQFETFSETVEGVLQRRKNCILACISGSLTASATHSSSLLKTSDVVTIWDADTDCDDDSSCSSFALLRFCNVLTLATGSLSVIDDLDGLALTNISRIRNAPGSLCLVFKSWICLAP